MYMKSAKHRVACKKKLDGAGKVFRSMGSNYMKMAVPRVKKKK